MLFSINSRKNSDKENLFKKNKNFFYFLSSACAAANLAIGTL